MLFALVASYGKRELTFGAIVSLLLAIAAFKFPPIGILALLIIAFFISFFRDPERVSPGDESMVVSPADGRVVEISDCTLKDDSTRYKRISIFLALYNVHVNRMPVTGTISGTNYIPGKFINAQNPDCANVNECNWIYLKEKATGKQIILRQISGVAARRIVCAVKGGDSLARGERIGMIKFGSRTEIYVPIELVKKVDVAVGDRVRGGETVIMEIANGAQKEG